MIELNIRFKSPDRFAIKFDDRKTDALEFKAPVNDGDRLSTEGYISTHLPYVFLFCCSVRFFPKPDNSNKAKPIHNNPTNKLAPKVALR